jgi:hypothetical protein
LEKGFVVDLEVRPDILFFQGGENGFIEKGDLEEKILIEGLFVDPELFRAQPDRGNPAAFPVSPVVHLHGGFENMAAAHRDVAGKPRNAASSLLCLLQDMGGGTRPQMAPRL